MALLTDKLSLILENIMGTCIATHLKDKGFGQTSNKKLALVVQEVLTVILFLLCSIILSP